MASGRKEEGIGSQNEVYKELERTLLSTRPMGVLFRMACLTILMLVSGQPQPSSKQPQVPVKTGDVVLQASRSRQSALIRQASESPYSHVGIVEVARDGVFVLEAVQPVSRTPWKRWRARGTGGKVTVLRAKGLEASVLSRVVAEAKRELGKPYDALFRWDEEALYCSELVAKAFERGAKLHVGTQQHVKSLKLSAADLALAPSLGIDPEQTLLTPASLAHDRQFVVVHSDF
jgi:hypothetical protein